MSPENQKPSIKVLSELTGYSISTVSRVLNGLGDQFRISKKAQAEILKKSKEIKFTPNQIARGLRLKRTNTIGLIVPDISNPFFAEIAKIITRKARSLNQSILLLDSEDTLETENQCLQTLLARKTDGILLFPSSSENKLVTQIHEDGVPIVLVDRYYFQSEIPYITSDNRQGAKLATEYLLRAGHRYIACIQGNQDSSPNQERVKGFLESLEAHQIPGGNTILIGNAFSEENGYVCMKEILRRRHELAITALFTLSNLNAMGAIRAIREAGLNIPDDLSVITFDNQEMLTMISPSITAVDQPKRAIGEEAMELIMKLIQREPVRTPAQKLPTHLIERNSVKTILH